MMHHTHHGANVAWVSSCFLVLGRARLAGNLLRDGRQVGRAFPSIFELPYLGQNLFLWLPLVLVGTIVLSMVGWEYPVGKAAAAANVAFNKAMPKKD